MSFVFLNSFAFCRAWEPFLCEDPYCSSHEYHENIVKAMLKKKIHEYKECGPKDYTPEAAEAIMNILRGLHTNQKWEYLTSPNKRECLGRELCLRSLKSHQNDEGNFNAFCQHFIIYI